MRQRGVIFASFVLAIIVFAGLVAHAQQAPPAPVGVTSKEFPITVTAGQYTLINTVIDLPPGGKIPKHVHGGPAVVTIVSGELTLTDASGAHVLKAGQGATEKAGYAHAVANNGTETARVSVSYLIPKGGKTLTIVK